MASPGDARQGSATHGTKKTSSMSPIEKEEHTIQALFKHRGAFGAEEAGTCSNFRGQSEPRENDTWHQTLRKEMRPIMEDVIKDRWEQWRERPSSVQNPFAFGGGIESANKEMVKEVVNRTLTICDARGDLKDADAGVGILCRVVGKRFVHVRADMKRKLTRTRRREKVREPNPDDKFGNEIPEGSYKHAEQPHQQMGPATTAVELKSTLRPIATDGEDANGSRPLLSFRPDPHVLEMSGDQDQTATPSSCAPWAQVMEGSRPYHVTFNLHCWSTEESEPVNVGPADIMLRDLCIDEVWSRSRMMENHSRCLAFVRLEPYPAALFPDLTQKGQLELFCLVINGQSKSVLLTGLPDSLYHCWNAAIRTWGGPNSSRLPEVDLLLFDNSLSKEVLRTFFPSISDESRLDR